MYSCEYVYPRNCLRTQTFFYKKFLVGRKDTLRKGICQGGNAGFFTTKEKKSRSDEILFAVDFNLRTTQRQHPSYKVAQRRHIDNHTLKYRPMRDYSWYTSVLLRRLKSTVNKVSSLRDYVFDFLNTLNIIIKLKNKKISI